MAGDHPIIYWFAPVLLCLLGFPSSDYANGDLSYLAWSPDGNWLAYNLGSKIYLLPPYGGTPTLLKDGGGPFVGWFTVP